MCQLYTGLLCDVTVQTVTVKCLLCLRWKLSCAVLLLWRWLQQNGVPVVKKQKYYECKLFVSCISVSKHALAMGQIGGWNCMSHHVIESKRMRENLVGKHATLSNRDKN